MSFAVWPLFLSVGLALTTANHATFLIAKIPIFTGFILFGVIMCAAGYVAWFWALGRGGIARISAWQLAQPPLTVVFALVLLGERVTLPMAAAGLTVFAGTALTQLQPRR